MGRGKYNMKNIGGSLKQSETPWRKKNMTHWDRFSLKVIKKYETR